MKVGVEVITPSKAKEYLEHNHINRNINKARVTAYANDMKRGAWQTNGESIKFNKKGELIDGQHRLSAIVLSNVEVATLVLKDIDNDINLYDRGRTRDVKDALIIDGMSRDIASNMWVAVAKLHYIIQKNNRNVSDYDVRLFLEKHIGTIEVLNRFKQGKSGMNKSNRVPVRNAPMMLAFLYAYESGEDIKDLERFAKVYSTGFYEKQTETPAIVIRNDTISGVVGFRETSLRISSAYKFEKAINDFCLEYPRKKSYSCWNYPVYSNNEKFKEV